MAPLLPSVAAAQDPATAPPAIEFALGGTLSFRPDYPGATSYGFSPAGHFKIHALRLGKYQLAQTDGWLDPMGTKLRGSLRLVGARRAASSPELAGLADVARTVELGMGLSHRTRHWQVFADARRGFGGHRGWAGEAGANVFAYPTDRLTVFGGPRIGFGDRRYNQTYFGVTAAEALTSTFADYAADAGVNSYGVGLHAVYSINDRWAALGGLSYDRLSGPAARSPIVAQGTRDQVTLSLGLARKIQLK